VIVQLRIERRRDDRDVRMITMKLIGARRTRDDAEKLNTLRALGLEN